jgi:thymidylate kinase
VSSAFTALDEQGIRWCLLRNGDLGPPGGEVDVLVARSDLERARDALALLGFARLPVWGHGSHAFFLGYHVDTDLWVCLDIVTDVRFGTYQGLRVPIEAELLARLERRDGVPVLAPDDAFWMLLLHSLLDKETVPVRHRARLQQLAPSAGDESMLARLLDPAAPFGWTLERVAESINSGDWAAIDSLGRQLRGRLLGRQRPSAFLRGLGNRSLRVLRGTMLRPPGLIVALLAPDGAGKSTLAAGLRHSFPTYDVRVVYMGLYQGEARWLLRAVPGLYVATRLALAWARYLRARVHRAAGRLVVLDRYVYDTLLPPRQPLPGLQRAHAWLVAHSLPAPDLVLVLDIPGDTAFARKNEHEPQSLEYQRRGYLALVGRLRHAHVVDATADADSVRRRAVSLIWSDRAR